MSNFINWNKYSWYCYKCHFFVSTLKCAKCNEIDPNNKNNISPKNNIINNNNVINNNVINNKNQKLYQKTDFNNNLIRQLPTIIVCCKCKKNNNIISNDIKFQNCFFCGTPNYVDKK